jgi:hypothetical protein
MNKQSSIEWLIKQLNQKIDFIPMNKWDEITEVIEQAKAMHKEEIKTVMSVAFLDGLRSGDESYKSQHEGWEDYYFKAFGGNK